MHELPRDVGLVGVDDEVADLVAVLPEVGLHVLRQEQVVEAGADVLQTTQHLRLAQVGAHDLLDLVEECRHGARTVDDGQGLKGDRAAVLLDARTCR